MPQIFKQLSISSSKELSNCVVSHCHKDSFTLWHAHTVPVSGDLHVHLQHHCLFWLREFSCFHMLSVGGVVAPSFCVSMQSSDPLTSENKPLSEFTYMHQKCVWLLFAPFIVAILAGVESSQCLRGILAALPDIGRGHNTVRQHLTMSDHILAAVPSVAFSIPPTPANFCASQTLTASQADSCSNRLLLVMPGL